jgi:hypothetical protein
LWRICFGGAREIVGTYFGELDVVVVQCALERGTAWRVAKLRRDERTADAERRAQQFFDGPNSFTDKELLALARFPAF